jgi:hypothetical protein
MRSLLLKLLVSEEEKNSLLKTMEAYTRAFGYAAEYWIRLTRVHSAVNQEPFEEVTSCS